MFALMLIFALVLPCGGDHLWSYQPQTPPWPASYTPGPDNPDDWYCVPGSHRGRRFLDRQPL